MEMINKHAMGWIPDYPDFRDYTEDTTVVKEILKSTGLPVSSAGRPQKRF
jgi:hypothetical protein